MNLSADHAVDNIAYADNSGNYSLQTSLDTNWYYTVRGRLGYIVSSLSTPFMIYTTGGLAATNISVSNSISDTTNLLGVGGGSANSNQTGWTIGAGFEYPITHNLTINSEYLYMQFGSVTAKSAVYNSAEGYGMEYHAFTSPFNTAANLSTNLFRVGINYKFNSLSNSSIK